MEIEKSDKAFRPDIREVDSSQFRIFTDVDNYLSISEETVPEEIVEAQIDKGIISGNKRSYRVRAEAPGVAKLMVTTLDDSTKQLNEKEIELKVDTLPLPYLTFHGMKGGLIKHRDLFEGTGLELKYDVLLNYEPHRLVQFTVSKAMTGEADFISFSDNFTQNQWELISNLNAGTVFYIKDIIVVDPSNNLHKLDPIAFIIQ
jgi:hypothetical protein